MDWMTQFMIAWEMLKQWCKETFGGGIHFPTAPGYQEGYSK